MGSATMNDGHGGHGNGEDVRPALDAGQVAAWLQKHPEFFERHRDLLSGLTLKHPHGGRAISLIERQVAVLRDENRRLEKRLADFLRIGRENDALSMKMQALSHAMLGERDPARLPGILVANLKKGFDVPAVLVRLWADLPMPDTSTGPVSTTLQQWADRLDHPYCGPSTMDEIAGWFPDRGASVASVAVMPLRAGNDTRAFGLLVLASDDPDRFQLGMGTVVLEQLADMAGSALSRALPADPAGAS